MRAFFPVGWAARFGVALAVAGAALLASWPESSEAAGRGGVQRVAMRPGSYSVPARSSASSGGGGGGGGGTGAIPAFCLDQDLDLPKARDTFAPLAKGSDVRIQLGDESMSLDQALARRLVKVRGSDIFEALQSDADIAVVIENLDSRKRQMTVVVGSPTMLGSGPSLKEHSLLTPTDVLRGLSQGDGERSQRAIWAIESLRKGGYGKRGDSDAAFAESVGKYQEDIGVKRSGVLDEGTLDAIDAVRRSDARVRVANTASGGLYRVMHVTRSADPAKSAFYRIQAAGVAPKLVDTAEHLVDEINKLGNGAGGVYVLFDGPSFEKDLKALQFSLERRRLDLKTKLIISDEPADALARSQDTLGWRELFFKADRPASVTKVDEQPIATSDGRFSQRFSIETGFGERVTVEAKATKPSILARFFAKLRAIFSSPSTYQGLSYVALIQKARLQTAADLGIDLAQLDQEIRLNVRQTQLAHSQPIESKTPSL